MSLNFQDSLSKLERLSPEKLDETSRRIRGDLASAEWKMGLCLLALKRGGAFRKLGFGTLTGYAERVLNLSGRKVGALLSAAEALEHLPLMSEAYRTGNICWSKVRVMHGLATPETEAEWLTFAKEHTSVEVERKVAVSPRDWKRHRAMEASLAGRPVVDREDVSALLSRTDKPELTVSSDTSACSSAGASVHTVDGAQGRAGESKEVLESADREGSGSTDISRATLDTRLESPSNEPATEGASVVERIAPEQTANSAPPLPPQTIRLTFELTPDQYALYEQAESRIRAQEGRRLPRAEVLKKMAELVLSQGTARARARHQVLVHKAEGSEQAWYETERGILPVAPEVLEEAMQSGNEVLAMGASGEVEVLEDDTIVEVDATHLQPNNASVRVSSHDNRAVDSRSGQECSSARTHRCETGSSARSDKDGSSARAEEPAKRVSSKSGKKRKAIPNPIVRLVHARAGHRCECCGKKGGRLDVHHRDPVCEGGANDPECLELLCRACHTKKHELDFENKAHWRAARAGADTGVKSHSGVLSDDFGTKSFPTWANKLE